MSAQIIPFDFEEQAVRVVMRDGEPWFVAADVCRVLDIGNRHDAVSRLDDDERDAVDTTDSIGRSQQMTIISESGLYALILTSRKEQAKRFRKWITAEVLPAIRRTGRYEHPSLAREPRPVWVPEEPMSTRDWLALVREARLLGGHDAGRRMWAFSPLPPLTPAEAPEDPDEGWACLEHLLTWCDEDWDADGLRALEHGVFVANFALQAFENTPWANGLHRAALLTLPGVRPHGSVLSLQRRATRGLVLPWALVREEDDG